MVIHKIIDISQNCYCITCKSSHSLSEFLPFFLLLQHLHLSIPIFQTNPFYVTSNTLHSTVVYMLKIFTLNLIR